jgi:hypothetical protein
MEAAKMIYRELDYQMNPTMLTQHWEAIESLLTDPKKKVEKKMLEIGVLNESMKQAQNLSIRLDTQIKLATVKYFDEYEDPFGYDHKYNLEKVKFWSSNNDISTFFFESASKSISATLGRVTREFPELFERNSSNEHKEHGTSFYFDELGKFKSGYKERIRFAKGMDVSYESLVRRSYYQFYLDYSIWLEAIKKQK